MDFVKKFAEEQLEKQMGGGQQNQGQSGKGGGLGGLLSSFAGGGQGQQQHQQQQSGGYGGGGQGYQGGDDFESGRQNYQGGQNYQGSGQGFQGGRDDYESGRQNYGGQNDYDEGRQNFGGRQDFQGGQSDYEGGRQSGGFGVTGGPQYNAPHGSGGASSFHGGGGVPNINPQQALQAADQHAGNGNENASLFSTVFNHIQGMNKDDQDVDEDDLQRKHSEAYGQGQAGNMSANAIGSAAALQAIKQFTSGSSGAASGSTGPQGGDMTSKIIGMAVSEAAKLFDQSGGAASGSKQDAVTSAGQTVMKLLLKNQVSGMIGGGQSGGLGSLMSMASKFM